jgi:hypothetical protein
MISQSGVTIARPIRTSPIGSHGLLLPWKILIAQAALFISSIPATAAETWLCTFPGLISSMAVKERLEVRATEVIRDGQTAYRIVQNNDRSVIATYARTQPADAAITVGTLAIDKPTGDFVISVMVPGAPLMSKVVTGKCQLDR